VRDPGLIEPILEPIADDLSGVLQADLAGEKGHGAPPR